MTRAPDRVAEAERLLLADADDLAERRTRGLERVEALAALLHRRFELEADVEIIVEHSLATAGDEDELLDARLARFIHGILDERPVHDRDHLLRDALRGGEQAGAEAGDGEHRLANAGWHLRSVSWSARRRIV